MILEVLSKLHDLMENPTIVLTEVIWKGEETYPNPDGL